MWAIVLGLIGGHVVPMPAARVCIATTAACGLRPQLPAVRMCTATTAAIAPENTFSCKYCGTQLSSRNHLYRHLREEAACGEQAVADGFDLEARRERKIHKVALLVGYTHGDSTAVGELVRTAVRTLEGEEPTTLTRATGVDYRRSELLRHTTMPAVEDVFVYASRAADEALDADDQARVAWLTQLNEQLHPHGISVL